MPQVYAASFQLTPRHGSPAAQALTAALCEWVQARYSEMVAFELTEPSSVRTEDGSILRWEPFQDPDRHLLDFTWRHPHADNPRISWSTRVAYVQAGDSTTLSIQVENTGANPGEPGALLTTRPRLILHLLNYFEVRTEGMPCNAEPIVLARSDISSFVKSELFDPERRLPIVVLSPTADGSYVVNPQTVAAEFVSLAKTYVIASPGTTYVLTHALRDRKLSCFQGALRAYLGGFSPRADPYKHPLLLPRRLAAQDERYKLAKYLALLTTHRFTRDPILAELRDERAITYEATRRGVLADLTQRKAVAKTDADFGEWAEYLIDAIQRRENDLGELEDRLRNADSRIEWLETERARLLHAAATRPDVQDTSTIADVTEFEVDTVQDAVEAAQELHKESLLFLPTALESAEASDYRRPHEVHKALGVLADVAQRSRGKALGVPLRKAFKNHNIEYASGIAENTSKELRRQYEYEFEQKKYYCYQHLCLGDAYDPKECLRIYFTTHQRYKGKAVVGHVGRHKDVRTTT